MTLSQIPKLSAEGVNIDVSDAGIVFAGIISMRDPADTIGPFLRRVHFAVKAAGLTEFEVDLRKLRFMNSSSIRMLVDWLEWIRNEPATHQYRLRFIPDTNASWQTTTLSALKALNQEHVVLQEVV